MSELWIFPILLSFLVSITVMPHWMRKARNIGLMWDDINKINSKKVAGSGGLVVVLGFILGTFLYMAIKTFLIVGGNHFVEVFALTTSVLMLAGIGIIDDLLGWQHGGLRKRHRLFLVGVASIPLVVINAGSSQIFLPFFGSTEIGIIYPLLIIPLGIMGATTTFNFLAGFNGLEASQGIIILSSLAAFSFITGTPWLGVIALCMIAALLGFLFYNINPARIFPGDVLTYPVGGLIAIMAILGNYELFALFLFIPYVLETGLKVRGRLVKQSFGLPRDGGAITNKYDKIYGLEHLAIRLIEKVKGKAHEWEVVFVINVFQLIFIILGFIIFV